MQKFIRLLIGFCALILFTSCNANALEGVFFTKADIEDVEENSIDIVLAKSVSMTVMKVEEYVQLSSKTEIRTNWFEEGTIPANTKIRLLAKSYLSDKTWGYLKADFVVELPDGSRSIASIVNQGKDFKPDNFVENIRKLPSYDKRGRVKIIKPEVYNNLIGKSLYEVEQLINPANQITVKGRVKEITFSNAGMYRDSLYLYPIVLKSENDIIIANVSCVQDLGDQSKFLNKLVTTFDKMSNSNVVLWNNFHAWKKLSFVGKIGYPIYIARTIISGIIFFVLFFVFYILIVPQWALKTVSYIKPLGNGMVQFLSYFVYLVFICAGFLIWSPFSMIGYILVIITVFFAIIPTNIRHFRCPYCHTCGKIGRLHDEDLDTTEHEQSQIRQVQYGTKTITDQYDRKRTTPLYRDVKVWKTVRTKHWREHFYCDACHQDITYRESETI